MNIKTIIASKLTQYPYLLEYSRKGLINIHALSLELSKEINKEFNLKSSPHAIGMSIRRYLKDLPDRKMELTKFPDPLEMTSRSGIYEIALTRNNDTLTLYKKIGKEFSSSKGDFLSIMEGSYELVFLTNQKNKEKIKKLFKKKDITSEIEELAYITVSWTNATKKIPGIYSRITRALALQNISIQSLYTIGSEMMILVDERDLKAAHNVLRSFFD